MSKSFIVFVTSFVVVFSLMPNFVMSQSPSTSVSPTGKQGGSLQNIIAKGDAAIAQRLNSLNTVISKIQTVKRISQTDKTNFINQVQTEITNLNTLKNKLDADTSVSSAKADYQTIFGANRVYLLFIPKMHIYVVADVIGDIVNLMTQIQSTLQTRIQNQQSNGNNPPSQVTNAMADLASKLTDATNQSGQAVSTVTPLQPDNGNSATLQSNNTALKSARGMITNASSDLKTARADIQTVWQWLRSQNKVSPSPSLTPTAIK